MKDLLKKRREIDTIDNQIVGLLVKRWQIVTEIGEIKKEMKLSIVDNAREQAIVDRLKKGVPATLWNALEQVYRTIFAASRELE